MSTKILQYILSSLNNREQLYQAFQSQMGKKKKFTKLNHTKKHIIIILMLVFSLHKFFLKSIN